MPITLIRLFAASGLLCAATSSCVDARFDRSFDSEQLTVSVQDASGAAAELDALPRRPTFTVRTTRPLDLERSPVLLLTGTLDDALRADLEKPPLLAAHRSRLVACDLQLDPDGLTLTPRRALDAAATYTLGILGPARTRGGGTLGTEAFSMQLEVASDPSAGAQAIASFPADASAGVPTNLRFAAIVFDGWVSGADSGLWLEDADGLAVPTELIHVPCSDLESRGQQCIALVPAGLLAPLSRYTVRTGRALRDARGAAVDPFAAHFVTADGPDLDPPEFVALPCALDETNLGIGCVLADEHSYTLRMRASEAVRLRKHGNDELEARLAPLGEVELSRGQLSRAQDVSFGITLADAAGNEAHAPVALVLAEDLATLSITELRADPRGAEPDQEYVELANYGERPVSLLGFSIADAPDDPGTPITQDVTVYPGARVLLVADAFDARDPLDAMAPAGARLVRVGPALTRGGLGNAGEPLFLRDARGRRVSAAPAGPKPRPGICNVRITTDPRSGAPSSFGYDADAGCTPGR